MSPITSFRIVFVLCVIAGVPACTYSTGVEQEFATSFPVSGRAAVRVHVSNARIHVSTSAAARVDFQVRYDTTGDESQPFAARQDGNVIELRERDLHRWSVWGGEGIQDAVVEVRMPADSDVDLITSNGAIEISTVNGTVRLHSNNGAITASALKGSVTAESSNGSISAEDLDGRCDVSTSNGRIKVSGRFDGLNAHSSNGLIEAHAASGSTTASGWDIGTSNAPIELSLPTTLKADLDLSTSNGGMQLELPVTVQGFQDQSHLHGLLNGGGPEVSVHTSNGHIRIRGV